MAPLSDQDTLDLSIHSHPHMHDTSSTGSFRNALGSFGRSYSRTSALYMADNLSLSRHGTVNSGEWEEEARQDDVKSR
jgi:hypothetical protein